MAERPPIDTARIRKRMRQLEDVGDRRRSPAEAISETLQLTRPGEPVDARLLAALNREIGRAEQLAEENEAALDHAPRGLATVCFQQGVMFAYAVRDLLDAIERERGHDDDGR